jgi:hypothetical protein
LKSQKPKGLPWSHNRLTEKQFNLLSYVFFKSCKPADTTKPRQEEPVIWSAKTFLGRSPTKAEAATLSRRVATLNNHGLLKKSGRMVTVTDYGKTMLRTHVLEHETKENGLDTLDPVLQALGFLLDIHESEQRLDAIQLTMRAALAHGKHNLLVAQRSVLPDLYKDELTKRNRLLTKLEQWWEGRC